MCRFKLHDDCIFKHTPAFDDYAIPATQNGHIILTYMAPSTKHV